MTLTPIAKLPYPELTDTPDVPRDMSALAARLDAILGALGVGIGVGEIRWTATADSPTGWLECQGQAVSRATYSALFAALGSTYGPGDGATTFNLPDFRGRVPVGAGTGTGGGAASAGGAAPGGGAALAARARGHWGGMETVALTIAELPSHDHGTWTGGASANRVPISISDQQGSQGISADPYGKVIASHPFDVYNVTVEAHVHQVSAQGSNGAHSNIQPTLCVRALIRALPY